MRLDTRAFTSKVARRAFAVFVACALLPVSVLAIVSFRGVTSELYEQSERRLRQASKSVAIVLYRRLLTLEAAMETAAARPDARHDEELPPPFTAVALVTAGPRTTQLSGRIDSLPALTAEDRDHLASGKSVLATEHAPAGPPRFYLIRALDPQRPERGILYAEINPSFLWVFDDEIALPPSTVLVVLDASGRSLLSSFGASATIPPVLARQASRGTAGHFVWSDGAEEYDASHWSLFLQFRFRTPKWTIVVSQPKTELLAPIANFRWTFIHVVLLSMWIVVLLSVRQIRKSLIPLERLQDGTRRIAMGDFDTRVEVKSGDEFEELATSFNQMAGQLSRQFSALAMRGEINVALSRDRALEGTLQECAEILVHHLHLSSIGVWTLGDDGAVLELRASAGVAPPSRESQGRIAVGETVIGRIAAERRPYTTNAALEDPRLPEPAWSRRDDVVAFVGHPLVVEGRLLGVVAAFATRPLEVIDLGAFSGAAGDVARYVERKRVDAALHGSEHQVRQLQKIEAVGRLAGGIAHDFNNLLTVITGRSRLLLLELDPEHPARRAIQIIDATAERASLLTRQLLTFSRKQVVAPAVLDVREIVTGMTAILQRLIGEDIELVVDAGPESAPIKADRGQIEQVIVNLVVNARDAMPDGGRITIHTSRVELGPLDASSYPGVSPGAHVMLKVADTGTGMSAETRAHLFEPFFTTKEPGKGTGLGLATVYGIVRQSGGAIAVESERGAGSTFTICLPIAHGVPQESEPATSPPAGGSETVLVVEDETEVRTLVHGLLEDHGYVVLSAGRSSDAIRIAEGHRDPIHLLLTDVVLPEINGGALAERLALLRPEMAVLYMSGYSDAGALGRARPDLETSFLQKPFTPDVLLRKVRSVLDAATPATAAPPAR